MASSTAGLDLLSVEDLRKLLGDEVLVDKVLAAAASKAGAPGRANHGGVPSNMPADNPSRRVDILDIEDVASKVGTPGRCSPAGSVLNGMRCMITPDPSRVAIVPGSLPPTPKVADRTWP